MTKTPALSINVRERVRDSGEYEFAIRNLTDRRLTNIRIYYGRVLGPSCWLDTNHLGFGDLDIPPMVVPALDPQGEHIIGTRLWGSLREYEKRNSQPQWKLDVAVTVDGTMQAVENSSPLDEKVLATVTIEKPEKPTYVTFTYGKGFGSKEGESWSI